MDSSMASASSQKQFESNNEDEEASYSADEPADDDENPHVISEINTFLVSTSDVLPIVKTRNKIAKLSFSRPAQYVFTNVQEAGNSLEFDKDGDAILTNRRRQGDDDAKLEELNLFIEYENSTTLDLVGLQIWRGALMLADYIIHHSSELFKHKVILELGSGTGLSSVVASFYASKIVATDLNEPNILNLIEANVQHNKSLVQSEFLVKPLDFLNLNWSGDLEKCIAETDVILAADVVYHNKITEAFVQTLKKCLTTGKPKNVFIALEKRYVFTISDLDTGAPMYDTFMDLLQSILALSPCTPKEISSMESLRLPSSSNTKTEVQHPTSISSQYNLVPVCLDFPHYFNYERTKELVIWNIQPKN